MQCKHSSSNLKFERRNPEIALQAEGTLSNVLEVTTYGRYGGGLLVKGIIASEVPRAKYKVKYGTRYRFKY